MKADTKIKIRIQIQIHTKHVIIKIDALQFTAKANLILGFPFERFQCIEYVCWWN